MKLQKRVDTKESSNRKNIKNDIFILNLKQTRLILVAV